MAVDEFEPDEVFGELNRKFANVSLEAAGYEDIYKEIMYSDLYEYRDTILLSDNYQAFHSAMKNIRRYLTQDISLDRIQNVFDLGIQDRIVYILYGSGYDDLKYETAWTITNLAYGTAEQTENLVNTGIIDALIYCFRDTDNYRVKSQAAWALANVCIESPRYRESVAKDYLIGDIAQSLTNKCDEIYEKLTNPMNGEQFKKTQDGKIIVNSKIDNDDVKDLTWALANICRGGFKTAEHWEQYLLAFNAFSQCVSFHNQEIWSEACWGLSRILSNMYSCETFFEHLHLNPGLCPRLIDLLKNQNMQTVLPVLQTISNFSSGPNEYVQVLLDADLLNNIWWYMSPDTNHQLRRNAILTVANLAAGDEHIVRKVVYSENIMQSVISHITVPGHIYKPDEYHWIPSSRSIIPESKEEWRIVREALWVLSNILTLANDDCICALLRNHTKLIKSLIYLLHFHRMNLSICLKILDVLIRIVDRTNQISELTPPVQPIPRNPYAEEMVREGAISVLTHLCRELSSDELNEQTEILHAAIMFSSPTNQSDTIGLASAFGLSRYGIQLPGPNVRRIVHGVEDGDVRLIENAINGIQL